MSTVNIFFATGFEEVEALTVVDILRRAGITTNMVSTTGYMEVTGSHNIKVGMDMLFEDVKESDMIVLPGGVPGTPNLMAHEGLVAMINSYNDSGKYLAAICAAPTVYGKLGLLSDKSACCYPGMEGELFAGNVSYDSVTVDKNFITSRGLGTAIDFALTIVEILVDKATADELSNKIVYTV